MRRIAESNIVQLVIECVCDALTLAQRFLFCLDTCICEAELVSRFFVFVFLHFLSFDMLLHYISFNFLLIACLKSSKS